VIRFSHEESDDQFIACSLGEYGYSHFVSYHGMLAVFNEDAIEHPDSADRRGNMRDLPFFPSKARD
jgi:hypothetical protein